MRDAALELSFFNFPASHAAADTAASSTASDPIETIPNIGESAIALTLSADGRLLLASTSVGAKLWDTTTGRLIRTFTGHAADVTSVRFLEGDGNSCPRARIGR